MKNVQCGADVNRLKWTLHRVSEWNVHKSQDAKVLCSRLGSTHKCHRDTVKYPGMCYCREVLNYNIRENLGGIGTAPPRDPYQLILQRPACGRGTDLQGSRGQI